MDQAQTEANAWRERLVPMASEVVRSADAAYREGGAPMLLVLESSRQLLAAQLRQAQAEADLRRAAAELDRAVGRHVVAPQSDDESLEPIEELPP
jgi:cobalt-zinc-cadmium efflux system outer membrane protein